MITRVDADIQKGLIECVERLPDKALDQIFSGDEKDINDLLGEIILETYAILNQQHRPDNTLVQTLGYVNESLTDTYMRMDMLYFIQEVFGDSIDYGWHQIEWMQMASDDKKERICILASRDTSKSFTWTQLNSIWRLWRYAKGDAYFGRWRHGFLFSNNDNKAIHFMSLIKEMMENNPFLHEELYNPKGLTWKSDEIITKNEAKLTSKGFLGSARGYHPHWIVMDDILTDDALYSQSYRDKCLDYFRSVVINMLEPNGKIVLVGTPFHSKDIYSQFRDRERAIQWIFREYPIVFPNGKLLYPSKFNWDLINERRREIGSTVFGREMLLQVVTSDTSIFPWSLLENMTANMSGYKLCMNREAIQFDFQAIITGHDFAKSANAGADYTVFTVWAIDSRNRMILINMYRELGMSFGAQVALLKKIGSDYRPTVMVLESNNFQKIYVEALEGTGLPVHAHTTGRDKASADRGVPAMAVAVEQGLMKLPTGDEKSRDIAEQVKLEFNSMSFTDKGISGIGQHDDITMSCYMARVGYHIWKEGGGAFDFSLL